jgi:transposase-like protein
MPTQTTSGLQCPRCRADAYYRYGKTASGNPRFLCKVCNRQFSIARRKLSEDARPRCPACRKSMHIYMRFGNGLRFRCSDYPRCRTFLKRLEGTPSDA